MRLLVVSQYFWPENFRINDLVDELVRRGHEVTVLTGIPNYPDGVIFPEFKENSEKYSKYCDAEIIRVPMLPRGTGGVRLLLNYLSFAASATIIGTWRLRGRDFDVIFTCQLSPVTVGFPAVALRALKRIPMAFWILDLWPDTLKAVGVVRSGSILHAVDRMVKFIYKRCDLIMAQSKSFIPKIRESTDYLKRIEYFPSWAEQIFSMGEVPLADEVPLKQGSFDVMFAGNIGEAQDFPSILAAAEILRPNPKIRWLIVGDGRAAPWVADEIKKRNLSDSVFMLGRYPLERMPSFFKHADALLVSLKDEPIFSMTIPGKLQSYLAAGIPVLAMLDGEGAAVVTQANAGLTCAPGDHEGLAKAVLALSTMSESERKSIGMNGLKITSQEFDRSKLIEKLEFWLEELASRSKKKETK